MVRNNKLESPFLFLPCVAVHASTSSCVLPAAKAASTDANGVAAFADAPAPMADNLL